MYTIYFNNYSPRGASHGLAQALAEVLFSMRGGNRFDETWGFRLLVQPLAKFLFLQGSGVN